MSTHTSTKTISVISIALVLGFLSTPAMSCGSMPGFGNLLLASFAVVAGSITLAVMVVLIPVEVQIIRRIGLEDTGYTRTGAVYAYCLLAKAAGLAVIHTFMMNVSHGLFILEGVYSLMHFIVALVGFIVLFGIEWRRAAITALLISTVIPW